MLDSKGDNSTGNKNDTYETTPSYRSIRRAPAIA
jgi:hypothetical protein